MKYVTPSEIIEYLYCPRFIYFMNCLNISQNEDKRYLVMKGRNIHQYKAAINKEYLRKKLGCIDKKVEVYLSSETLHLVGKVDEVLFFDNEQAAPLDYKYAEYRDRVFRTYIIQQACYALLIEEIFQKSVNKAYIVYVRSNNFIKEISITESRKTYTKDLIAEIFDILNINYFPKRTSSKKRCLDCTYRNICVK